MSNFFVADTVSLPSVIAAGFVLCLAVTPYISALARRMGVLDIPRDSRRMHKRAVPLMGGGAMVLSFLICAALFIFSYDVPFDERVFALLFGAFLCAACGIIDDIFTLLPWQKLFFQLIVALFAATFVGRVESFTVFDLKIELGALSFPATALFIVLIMNAVNLIDGMDGLASGVCAAISFALAVVLFASGQMDFAVCACALCGVCLGFLAYNSAPASIFMGETGSAFLGFSLAVLTLPLYSSESSDAASTAVLLFLLPVSELFGSFLRRVLHGKSPFAPDKKHIHHLLYENGFSVPKICLILYTFVFISAVCAVLHTEYSALSAVLLAAAIVFIKLMLGTKFKKSRKKENRYEKK
jgi:UDP-GlcNAc:undecaprenyl-phosphate GlcNAc-1-phosphate transferase